MLLDREKHFYTTQTAISQFFGERQVEDNFDNDDECLGVGEKNRKPIFFDETLNMFFTQSVFYKNHYLEELKLSVRIAKKNLELNKNNYYEEQLFKAQNKLTDFLNAV